MSTRNWVIAIIVVCQLAIIGFAVQLIGGGRDLSAPAFSFGEPARHDGKLVEGGPHKTFAGGDRPAVTVDIGYADLSIVTGTSDVIDVALSPTTSPGLFNASEAITARRDGDHVRVGSGDANRWSTGDDRMVTLVVPAQTAVTVIAAGNIDVDGLRATASINSVGSGHINVRDFDGPRLRVTTSSGNITLERITTARLDATSSDGHIAATQLDVRDGSIESDGRVLLGFASGSDTLVTADAQAGKISTSGFAGGASFATGDSGDDGSSLTLRIGSGDGHLVVRANDGGIALNNEG